MKPSSNTSPPKWLLSFFRWFCHPEYLEDIEGDLCERFFQKKETHGVKKARFIFFLEVLRLFRPSLMKSFIPENQLFNIGMFKHNLLITFRGFIRNKTTFLINLIGLSTGLACTLLVFIWANDEISIDKFHEKDSQLYQVMTNFHRDQGVETWNSTSVLLAQVLLEDYPEVESATMINNRYWPDGNIIYGNDSVVGRRLFVDEQFFDVFSYNLIQGDSKQVLADKSNIVISEKLALDLFNSTQNVVGKTIQWNNPDQKAIGSFQISGIFETPPESSSEQFDAVLHYDWMVKGDPPAGKWTMNAVKTFLILEEGTNIDEFNDQIETLMWSKVPDRKTNKLFVEKFSNLYLYNNYENGVQAGGRIDYVKLFSIIALFILLIACINFMNLSTAQASRKMKEIGVKKAIGASRKALIFQFLSESIIMVTLSVLVAIWLAYLLLPQFNEITGKFLQIDIGLRPILYMGGIVLLTGLIAGSYPAFFLSSFKPISVLKGKRIASFGEEWIRKGLVVFQFSLSVVFIVGILVITEQMEFVHNKNLGFNRTNILSFHRPHYDVDPEPFLSSIRSFPGVEMVSIMENNILSGWDAQSGYSWRGQESDKKWIFKSPQIGYDVIETLGLEVIAGRSFSREFNDDYTKIILNESALKKMQLQDPIGKIISYGDGFREIVGVVSDFHYGSLHQKIEPLIFRIPNWGWGSNTMVRIKPGTEKATIEQLEGLYAEFYPSSNFHFTFLDEDYQQLYIMESKISSLAKFFGILAIIISCLGLFGLTAFVAERRTKEIGIRKILGSNMWGIIKLLSKDFTQMVLIAISIALPISYVISKNWLAGFAYRIDLQWWIFGIAAFATMLIAWITVSYQTLKIAHINPAQCLRDE